MAIAADGSSFLRALTGRVVLGERLGRPSVIPLELRTEIRRLYYAEHWKVGTIASSLHVHHDTVRLAIASETLGARRGVCRPTALDPYLPFIRDILAQYPRLRATRLHEMLRLRGYAGAATQVRRAVRQLRPQPVGVYRRLETLVAEEAQCDWGSFGSVHIGRGTRTVSGFVMVLAYSRAMHALFTLDQSLESFLRGHVAAFEALRGSARTLVYDNLKSAVLDRRGTAIQFHPRLLELAGHYHFAPRPCTPARGNEKGKVERQIQYLRHAFFAARAYRDLEDLNAQFVTWRDTVAHQRRHPVQPDRTVAEVLAEEQPRLLSLPLHPFETDQITTVRSGKTPYVRFDRNLYSIPHEHVRQPLTLVASDRRVRLLAGTAVVADHPRSYDTGAVIDDPTHVAALLDANRQRHAHGQRDYLRVSVPITVALFDRLAARGEPLTTVTRRLLGLLDDYGADALTRAITVALDRGTPSVAAITHLLETARRQRGARPPMPLILPDRPGVRDLTVSSHTLESYDDLTDPDSDDPGK